VLVSDWVVFTRESLPTARRKAAGATPEAVDQLAASRRGFDRPGGGEASPEAQEGASA
jgi:hypothetical protein